MEFNLEDIYKKIQYNEIDLKRALNYFDIQEKDLDTLRNALGIIKDVPVEFFDQFYDHLLQFPETAKILNKDKDLIENLKLKQKFYFTNMLRANFDINYIKEKIKIGMVHYSLGVKEDYYIGAYSEYFYSLKKYVNQFLDRQLNIEFNHSLAKVMLLDINLTIKFYFFIKEEQEIFFRNLSEKDPLTGIYNKRKFQEICDQSISESDRYKKELSFIFFDIDNFKKVNDTFGHDIGDVVLKEIANIVKREIRKSDYFARWGGEEFILILPETNINSALAVAEKIRKSIEVYEFPVVGRVTVSIGVTSRKFSEDYSDLFKRLDDAVYRAKSLGKNTVVAN
ncbi:MAG: diguanylate cyclase [Thermodesulfobium sp.]